MRTTGIKHKLITALLSLSICISVVSGVIVFSDNSNESIVFDSYIISAPNNEQMTGDAVKITVSVSPSEKALRMYFRCDDPEYGIFRYSSNATDDSGVPVTIHQVDGEDNCYYYEIGPMDSGGSTVSIDFTFYYPNGTSGGNVEWWFAAASKDVFDELDGELLEPETELPETVDICETTFKSTWNTDEVHYDIEKTTDSNWSMYLTDDGKATVKNLSYQIEFEDKEYKTDDNNFEAELGGFRDRGADYVDYVEYEDILNLPDNLSWRDGLETAVYRTVGGGKRWEVHATVGGTDYLVATVVIPDGVQSVSVQDVGCEYRDGNVVLKWRVNNTKNVNGNGSNSGEIENVITQITYGPEVLIYTEYDGTAKPLEFELENTATADLHYFCEKNLYHSESRIYDDKRTDSQGSLYIKKERTTPTSGSTGSSTYYFFGEDVDYVITTHNESPFDYTKYAAVTDNLDKYHYIRSENMLKMFEEAKQAGESLEIVITDAVLVNDIIPETVTGTDGITESETGIQNTGADTNYTAKMGPNDESVKATLTISYAEDILTIRVSKSDGVEDIYQIGDGYAYPSIDDAFSAIGYEITSSAVYTVNWYKDNQSLELGTTRTYNVYATFKDTFMLLTEDNRKFYGNSDIASVEWNDIKISTNNTAHVTDQEGNKTFPVKDDTPEPVDIRPEFQIQKGFSIENDDYTDSDNDPLFADGSVLQYHVLVHHNGRSAYDVLPVTDQSTGAQAMMVKASENEGAEWISHAKEYTYNGELYYVLVPPEEGGSYTYNGVWVSGYFVDESSVRMYYAGSVTVTREADADRSITTLVKWYLTDTDGYYWDETISYKMLSDRGFLDCGAHLKANVKNWAYINDRNGHRLYDFKGGASFQFDFDKNIVTRKDADNPLYDALDRDKFTLISQNSTEVTYRLDFLISGYDGIQTLTGNDFYDSLPNNAGFFTWNNKGSNPNVKVSYVLTGETGIMRFGDETYATTNGRLEIDSPGTEFQITGTGNSQNISWNSDFSFTIQNNTVTGNRDRFYIYITLTFPGGDNDTEWKDYLQKNNDTGNLYLYNTLYVDSWPVEVRHQLTDPGKAFLQKGVYETGIYTTKNSQYNESTSTYFRRDDRTTYINNTASVFTSNNLKSQTITRGSVAYYILLKNSSDTNLYIDTIYDVLPKGFEYLSLRNNVDGDASYTGVGYTNYIYAMGTDPGVRDSWRQPLAGTGTVAPSDYRNNKDWLPYSDNAVRVTCSSGGSIDGHRILCFDILMTNPAADITGIGYDPVADKYYLKPGYYIQFGYECTTGLESESEDIANNAAAMPIADIDAELSLDDETPVAVNTQINAAPANDGARYLWDNDTAAQRGFTGKGADTRWLASDVIVRRGKDIVPGIEKTVAPEEDHPEANASVHWTVKAYNDGTAIMDNYQIVDTIQAPYHFTGNITYKNYTTNQYVYTTNSNRTGLIAQNTDNYLLSIKERGINDTHIALTSNGGTTAVLPLSADEDGYGEPVEMKFKITHEGITEEVPAKVSITQANLTETLTITFEYPRWNITSKGYVELGYETTNTTGVFTILERITNEATLVPSDAYDEASVTKGTNIKDGSGNNTGVSDNAYISIGVAEPTSSYKEVDEIEVPGQEGYAHSENGSNRIILADKTHTFRYTLNVESSASYDMDQLVIIDNLPENDDSNTLFDQPRGSAFTVSVKADDPNFEVLVYTEKDEDGNYGNSYLLSANQYEVQYKVSDSSGGFDHGDWSGAQRNDAEDERGEYWDKWITYTDSTNADDLAAARDIRLIVHGLNDDGTFWDSSENEASYTAPETVALKRNCKLSFSFNAVITNPDEEADYGDIAWNTFGYEYFIGVQNDQGDVASHYLYAAPSRVGISVPAVPVLTKSIVNSSGRSANAAEDKTFAFIIYEGDTVDFSDYTPETIAEALNDNGRSFTYVTVDVKKGESVSESIKLGGLKKYTYNSATGEFVETNDDWEWEEAQEGFAASSGRYSIVELDADSEYSYSSTKVGSAVLGNRNVSFDYTRLYNLTLEYTNSMPNWGVEVFKVDESNPGVRLQGAIFGLYSPNIADKISDTDLEVWGFAPDGIAKTITYGGTEYYLSKIAETGDDGRIAAWMSGLEESSYVIIELKAPEGYIGSASPIFVEYSSEYVQSPYKISVSNTGGKAPASVKVDLGLTKTVNIADGQSYDGGSFTFAIVPDAENPAGDPLNILPQTVTVTVPGGSDSVSAAGKIFDNVEFTESGIYKYKIYETNENADSRITYDTSVYDVTITVTEAGNMYGDDYRLEAAVAVTKTVNGETTDSDADSIKFVNTFNEISISIPEAGGAGVYLFCITGAMLALAALFLFTSNTKKRTGRRI